MQKLHIPKNGPQRIDEKNGVIYLVIMLTRGVMVIKNVSNGIFFVFSADDSKKSATVWTKIFKRI